MQILVTIGSGVSEGAGVEFPTFPLTCVVVLKTLWHYQRVIATDQRVWHVLVYIHRAIQNLYLLVRLHHDHVTTGVNESSADIDDICRQLRRVRSAYCVVKQCLHYCTLRRTCTPGVHRPRDILGISQNAFDFNVALFYLIFAPRR